MNLGRHAGQASSLSAPNRQDACPTLRFMESEHRQNSDVNRGHEPIPNPSGGGESMSGTLAEFPSWEGPGVGRFMESPLSFFRMHWDHEPPLTRPPATLSPSDGEREGVRGRFMERRDPAEDHGPNARQKFGEFSSPTFVPRYSICHSRLRQKLSLRYQTDNALRALATNREREPL